MNILLIRPPAQHSQGSARPSASLPLGLLYIAAVLEKNGYTVQIYDAQINVLAPTYRDLNSGVYMGDRWEVIEEQIRRRRPALVGISCLFTAQMGSAVKTAEIVKKINKDIAVVMGGNHASVRPEDFFLKTKAVDMVCVGEGEYTMLDIAESLRDKRTYKEIPGIAFLDCERIKINPPRPYIRDLDALPLPSYHLINMEDYFHLYQKGFSGRPVLPYRGSERAVSLITSRGCPFNCIFCSIHLHMGRQWRYHSAEYVLGHLEFLSSRYNIRHVHFEDDNLTLDIDRFKAILDGLCSDKVSFSWDTPNGIRADTMTKEVLSDCKKSGCVYLIFGIESGNQKVLDDIIGKRLDLGTAVKVAAWCREVALDTMAFFVIGFPGETRQAMRATVDFALWLQRRYDCLPSLFVATPLPGTRLEQLCMEKGILEEALSPSDLSRMTQGALLINGDTFLSADLKVLLARFYKNYKINFIYNALLFFMSHPRAFFRLAGKIMTQDVNKINKEAIFNILQFKNCLLKQFA
jgi:radical SAM superfamily enzyme YgiQ (UPF0313 family)